MPAKKIDMAKFAKFCKDNGFIFQSSEIYGGINGFWDYGPRGVGLKNNTKQSGGRVWVRNRAAGADGRPDLRGVHRHVGGEGRGCERGAAVHPRPRGLRLRAGGWAPGARTAGLARTGDTRWDARFLTRTVSDGATLGL